MTDQVLGGSTPAAAVSQAPSPAAPSAPANGAPAQAPALSGGDNGLGVLDPAVSKAGDADGFDWRAAMSRGDQKKLAKLSRYSDLGTIADSFFNQQEKISKGLQSAPGEGATPEDIAAYRQSLGMPDKAEAYEFAGDFADTEKPVIEGLKAAAFDANFTPAQMGALSKWYDDFKAQVITAQVETNNQAVRELRNTLIEEMGPRDFERGAVLANQFLADKGALDLASMTLEGGVKLGAHPGFVKLIMGMARDYASDDLVAAVEAPNSKSVDARLEEIYGLMNTDRAKYNSKAVQDELFRLTSIQETRAKRAA